MKGFLLVLLVVVATMPDCFGQERLDVVWDDRLMFRSRDGGYEVNIGGRLHYDISFLGHDKILDSTFRKATDGVEVRRARISLEGSIRNTYEYEFDVSFADEFEFNDMLFTFLNIPAIDRLTLGHFREPFGMEENTSSNAIPFMERSLTTAFGTSRNAGIMVQRHFFSDKLGIHAGVFRITDSLGSEREGAGKNSYSGRVGINPVQDTTANRSAHIGFGLNTQTLVGNILKVEAQNESNLAPDYISSGEIENVDRLWQVGGEAGFTQGRFTLQSEYMHAFARIFEVTDQLPDDKVREFNSFYIIGSYFLIGGKRSYDVADNTFSDISLDKPDALELALRYSQIKLLDNPQTYSKMSDISLGLNYYLSESTRLMMNYVFSRIAEQHHVQVLQFRLQVSF